jgi:hypothetical protein
MPNPIQSKHSGYLSIAAGCIFASLGLINHHPFLWVPIGALHCAIGGYRVMTATRNQ